MDIIIRNDINTPIYEQIYKQIRNNIVNKKLKPHQQLPSIRLLAKNLKVSVITSKRAYEELERDGYIYSVAGRGSYVADTSDEIMVKNYLVEIEEHMEAIIKLANVASISDKKLNSLYKKIRGDYNEGNDL